MNLLVLPISADILRRHRDLARHSMIPFQMLRQVPLTTALLLLITYLLSPFFVYYLDPGGFNDQRTLQLVWMTVCLLVLLSVADYRSWFINWIRGLSPQTTLCLVLFLAAASTSAVLAPETLRAFQEVGLYMLLVLSMAVVACELSRLETSDVARLLAVSLGIWLVIYVLYFLIYYFSVYLAEPERFNDVGPWMPNFYNQRSFNQVEVWLLPAFFWLCHRASQHSPGRASIVYVLTAVWWAMLCYSLGRGISLAMVVAMIGVAVIFRRQALLLLKPALTTLVLGLLIYWLMFLLPQYLYLEDVSYSYADRVQDLHSGGRAPLWHFAWESFLQHPLLGFGPQHYAYFYESFSHAHNVTLNSLAELGLLGTVPLIALALIAAWSIIRRALDAPSPLAMVLVFCLFSVGTYSQFTAQFYFPAAQLVLILFAGLAIDWFSRDAPERDPGTVATSRFGIPLACIVVLMSVATLGISYTDLVVRPHALYQVRYFNYPRFWLNGKFATYPHRLVAPRAGACKVHAYAPVFPCR